MATMETRDDDDDYYVVIRLITIGRRENASLARSLPVTHYAIYLSYLR